MKYVEIIEKAKAMGLEEVEVYAKKTITNKLSVENGQLDSCKDSDLFSIDIRGSYNGQMCSAKCEAVDEETITAVLNKIKTNATLLTSKEKDILFDGKAEYENVENPHCDFNALTQNEKIAMLAKIEKEIKAADARIKKVDTAEIVEVEEKISIINSKGLNLTKEKSYVELVISAFATEGDSGNNSFEVKIKTSYKDFNTDEIVKKVVEKAVSGLNAKSVKSGEYPIVLSTEVASNLLHAFSSIFSGYMAMRKTSALLGKKGMQVFGSNITIVDDPFASDALIKEPFDDEGVPCQKKKIIDKGVFTGFMHSQKTAKFFNEAPTGNGFKAGGTINPAPTNFYIEKGDYSLDQLYEGIEEGIYVTDVAGLHAGLNPISGDFHVQSSGKMIRNGKIAESVTLFVIAGNYFDMLNNVEKIGNDIEKGFIDVVSPSLKVKKLMVSGK